MPSAAQCYNGYEGERGEGREVKREGGGEEEEREKKGREGGSEDEG